jgi:adenylylsulfate kinase
MAAANEGLTIWLTGLPSAGKTTIARGLAARLRAEGRRVEVLEGEAVRAQLGRELGFSKEDRDENVRRIGVLADLLSRNGVIAIVAAVSPYNEARERVRSLHGLRFVEAHVAAPVEVCAQRDVKGLYARQRAGEVKGLTGVDDPYEAPLAPEVIVPTHAQSPEDSVDAVLVAARRAMVLARGGAAGK